MVNFKNIREEIARAERHEHPERLMRITLECGHFRLQQWQNAVGGIGFHTNCNICSAVPVTRLIVNMEETGVL
jgi:hypothetical protein